MKRPSLVNVAWGLTALLIFGFAAYIGALGVIAVATAFDRFDWGKWWFGGLFATLAIHWVGRYFYLIN